MKEVYKPVFVENHSQKGLIALCCGHTFHYKKSLNSWRSLIERYVKKLRFLSPSRNIAITQRCFKLGGWVHGEGGITQQSVIYATNIRRICVPDPHQCAGCGA
jgi:hypothetical protein